MLIGYYKSDEHLKWIKENRKYNIRTGDAIGSRNITSKEAGAEYLLLYGKASVESGLIYKLSPNGPRVLSKSEIKRLNYPKANHPSYLVFDLEDQIEDEFKSMVWKFKSLKEYYKDEVGAPFVVTLAELMKTIVK